MRMSFAQTFSIPLIVRRRCWCLLSILAEHCHFPFLFILPLCELSVNIPVPPPPLPSLCVQFFNHLAMNICIVSAGHCGSSSAAAIESVDYGLCSRPVFCFLRTSARISFWITKQKFYIQSRHSVHATPTDETFIFFWWICETLTRSDTIDEQFGGNKSAQIHLNCCLWRNFYSFFLRENWINRKSGGEGVRSNRKRKTVSQSTECPSMQRTTEWQTKKRVDWLWIENIKVEERHQSTYGAYR